MPTVQTTVTIEEQTRIAEEHGFVRSVWEMPKECPCCGYPVQREEGMVAVRCPNSNCPDQRTQQLKHAVSRNALDWKGLGEKQVAMLVKEGICGLHGMLALADEDIDKIFKKAGAAQYKKERERVKTVPWWRKLYALGIESIGKSICQDIAAKWSSFAAATGDQMALEDLIGPSRFNSLAVFVNNNVEVLCSLEEVLGFKFESDPAASGALSGQTFVITGTMLSGTRETVAEMIESHGGTVKGQVSKKVQYLVNGPGAGNNKAAAAAKHGTLVITEEQLYELAGVPMAIDDGVGVANREY